jgi:hypothetical protein
VGAASAYKVCPECRAEHVASAIRCADCDVDLVEAGELPADDAPVDLPPASELACVRVAPLPWIRALSDGLAERGVAHRVEAATDGDVPEGQSAAVFGDAQLFGLYVEEHSAAEARELDSGIAHQVLPGEAPSLEEGEETACPACGTALAADAVECADCGLVLG